MVSKQKLVTKIVDNITDYDCIYRDKIDNTCVEYSNVEYINKHYKCPYIKKKKEIKECTRFIKL